MELSPAQAAEIAESAYALRLSSDMLDAAVAAPLVRSEFDLLRGVRLTGITGLNVPAVEQRTGFGYVARGTGLRQGEYLVSVRGTFKTSTCDWLTNIRMGGVVGPSGYCVHAGFWRAAQSVLPQISQSLRHSTPSTLHVVGHSLGGAMATLIADSLSHMGCGIRLYTFGAPRAGVEGHAEYLTSRLGADHIYRVYHDTDPVPMVPVFPYCHVPYASNAYRMKGTGKLVSIDAHLMPGYRKSVGACSWSTLPLLRPKLDSFEEASEWLSGVAKDGGVCIMLSATALQLILSALHWLLKEIGKGFGYAVLGGATVIDALARVLYSGALQSARLAQTVRHMLMAAMRFMGRTVGAATQITTSFINYVLDLLFRFVGTMAKRAVDAIS
ncbi:MAG TPA: lipase family protein [Rhodanobacteraceae bacterium]|nr:lipase family protein [Rhodanobacteraceae bacterium]